MATPETLRLLDLFPDENIRRDDTGHLEKFLDEVLQPVLDLASDEIDRWVAQQDMETAEEQAVDARLADLGNPFPTGDLTLNRKRLLAKLLVEIYKSKGTETSLADVIRIVTGIEIVAVISPGSFDAWILGTDELEDVPPVPDFPASPTNLAVLGASAEWLAYSFQIQVLAPLTAEEDALIREVVYLVKPAHTHFLGFII